MNLQSQINKANKLIQKNPNNLLWYIMISGSGISGHSIACLGRQYPGTIIRENDTHKDVGLLIITLLPDVSDMEIETLCKNLQEWGQWEGNSQYNKPKKQKNTVTVGAISAVNLSSDQLKR